MGAVTGLAVPGAAELPAPDFAVSPGAAGAPTPSARRPHLHEIDVVRVLTFACVIGVHTTSEANSTSSVGAHSLIMLLHFTREAFFFLTGFVLVHQYLGRRPALGKFYRKRLLAVGVPYLVWTVVYTAVNMHTRGPLRSVGAAATTLWRNVEFGSAEYHLYFLLVSMQIYLLYPLLAWLVRATRGHHVRLLAASATLQVAVMSWLTYDRPVHGWVAAWAGHSDINVVSYQFFVIFGAVAAAHRARLREWAHDYGALVAALVPVTAIATVAWYFVELAMGDSATDASQVLQPAMLVWSVAAIAGLFTLGCLWDRHRRADSRLATLFSVGSDRSFGIYLAHPLILGGLVAFGPIAAIDPLPRTVIAYLLTVLGAVLLVEILRRSPLSFVLAGRPRLRSSAFPLPLPHRRGVTGSPSMKGSN